MVLISLRSLLVAAIVLSNCITWTASRHHYTHNVAGHRSRHRRQGKGLYLMSSSVIPGGEGTGWGEWGEVSPCSRTCGGGVASQKRICLQIGPDGQPQCTGGDTKYFSCETQDCPPGSVDFRAEQCSNYNNISYRGIRYKWKPYTKGPNPCELNCMPPGERFYYRHQAKVIDGTRCNDESFDVCVDGVCQPVGCDMMLGSNAREDKCRQCRGEGKNCYTTNGLLNTQDLIKGYNDIMLIPEGASTIIISEVKPSNNYLALRAENGTYYLNGDYHIDFPRSMMIAGALWYYERSQQGFAAPDKLRCLGPINEPIYLSLLLQSENVGIEYEYSLPNEIAPRPTQKYNWVSRNFTSCSAPCGGGYQTRDVTCRTEIDLEEVDPVLCDDGLKPVTNQTCNTQACPPEWVADEWGPCSKRCGEGGTQSREIRCEKIITNGNPSIVSDKECFDLLGPKPEKFQECNVNTTCPQWFAGPWKPCDKLYGEGKQTRTVTCYQKNGKQIDVLEDSECGDDKPETEKSCLINPDETTDWMTSTWYGCDNCLSVNRTRTAFCVTYVEHSIVNDSFCAHHPPPVLQEPCDTKKLPPCDVQWYATQWGKCSVECGEGVQNREVFCGVFVDDSVMKVDDSRCSNLTKYNDTKPCVVPKDECPSQWYAAPWGNCSRECGNGDQYRVVVCLRGDKVATDCNPLTVLDPTQACNLGPCNEDDLISLDSHSTPIMDEEECDYEDEEYAEVGIDLPDDKTGTTMMFSDSPSTDGGSGTSTIFTDDGFEKGMSEDFTEGSGSGDRETTLTETTDDTTLNTTETTNLIANDTYMTTPRGGEIVGRAKDLGSSIKKETVTSTVKPTKSSTDTDSTVAGMSEDFTEGSGSGDRETTLTETTDDTTLNTTETTNLIANDTYMTTPRGGEIVGRAKDLGSSIKKETVTSTVKPTKSSTDTDSTVADLGSSIKSETATATVKPTKSSTDTDSTVADLGSSIKSETATATVKPTKSSTDTDSTVAELSSTGETSESVASTTAVPSVSSSETDIAFTDLNSTDVTNEPAASTTVEATKSSNGTETTSTDFSSSDETSSESAVSTTDVTAKPSNSTESTTTGVTSSDETIEIIESTTIASTEPRTATKSTETDTSSESSTTSESAASTTVSPTKPSNKTESTVSDTNSESSITSESAASTIISPTEPSNGTESTVSDTNSESSTTSESAASTTVSLTELSNGTESTVSDTSSESSTTSESAASITFSPTEPSNKTESTVSDTSSESSTTSESAASTTVSPTEPSNKTESTVSDTNSESSITSESAASTIISPTEPSNGTESTVSDTNSESSITSESAASTIISPTEPSNGTESTVSDTSSESSTTSESAASITVSPTEPSNKTESTVSDTSSESSTTSESAASTTVSPTEPSNKTESTVSDTSSESSTTSESAASTTISPTEPSNGTESTVSDTSSESSTTSESAASITVSPTEPSNKTESTVSDTSSESSTTSESAASTTVSPTEPSNKTESTVSDTSSESSTTSESAASTTISPTEPSNKTESTVSDTSSESSTTSESAASTTISPTEPSNKTESTVSDTSSESSTTSESAASTTVSLTELSNGTESTVSGVSSSDVTTSESVASTTAVPTISTDETETTVVGVSTSEPAVSTTVVSTEPSNVTETTESDSSTTEEIYDTVPDSTVTTEGAASSTESTISGELTSSESSKTDETESTTHVESTTVSTEEPTESTVAGVSESSTETESSTTEKEFTAESTTPSVTSETTESSNVTTEISEERTTTEESSVQVITTEKSIRRDPFRVHGNKKCKRRKVKCAKTQYGCCPDRRTPAKGPFDEGCPRPKTCKESEFGCCPDEVSPALGVDYKGCPASQCAETLFGCCLSDNTTAAEGNNQEGCPPPPPACKSSTFGCCADGKTQAEGAEKEGCPEYSTSTTEMEGSTATESQSSSEAEKSTATESQSSIKAETSTTQVYSTSTTSEDCFSSEFGCCYDNETRATGPAGEGCPCNATEFGCCPDDSPAKGVNLEGCVATCNTSKYGCCRDGKTPAHGPDGKGCCLLEAFGCCPDNFKPAEGPHLEGCGCQYAQFGCCPDNVTVAKGPNREGCDCQYTAHGCCPDRHTEASGPNYEGCGCHTYQFGCCPDGVTIAKGPNLQGCDCRQSQYGCCGDGKTPASGPERQGCDCASSEFGCCPDGQTEAKGRKFFGCSDIPVNRQAACSLPNDRGSCRNFSVYWFYDLEYGGCSRFWYGGCDGNGNKFATKEECEDVCIQPSPKDACNLPKVKGACLGYHVRWYYDSEREHCSQFIFGGCLGNANNFESQQLCQSQCEPAKTEDQCTLPIDRGSCAGNFGRWGFNTETRRCEQFIWGGCEGNSNRFGSEAACIQRCDTPGKPKAQCSETQDVGNCTEKEAVWSFSQTENRCVPFYYTGCGGNGNRFESEESCAQSCPSAYVPDVCTFPAETGECADYREKWFYDTAEKKCRPFYYGGCGGNGNNFATQLECEGRCSEIRVTTTTVQPYEPPSPDNICFREVDPGPCTELETHWAYDYRVGRCIPFQYGGCGGNQNNFPTEQDCYYYCKPAQDICQMPMLSGPCNDSLMRWFYDPNTDSCSQFTYGGCEGNENRFESRIACERRCRTGTDETTKSTTTSTTIVVGPRIQETETVECAVSLSLETCVRSGQVWYLDPELKRCMAHDNVESGEVCRNTGVFPTEEACERSCGAFRDINVCRYTKDPGPCQSFVPKYYYDTATQRCLEFAYGGCHGGPNRFSSIDECLQVCKPEIDPCQQDPEPGNCIARYVMWYYDKARDQCLQFIYGGCGGNDNRFETREDCEGRCRQRPVEVRITTSTTASTWTPSTATSPIPTTSQPVAEECRTPKSLEPCGSNVTMFYYDQATRSCLVSQIGGCQYANSYVTEEECERRCGAFVGINVCEARLDPGPCRASIPKFYWDPASGSCQPYAYGGCGGGANRFSTLDECEDICGNTGPAAECLQPVSTGTPDCGTPSRRWHYSVLYADCLPFTYQGCAGTINNFPTYEECAQLCKVSHPSESNEVVPDCSGYDDECLQLVCGHGMTQERTREGCTKCSCREQPLDCSTFTAQCEELRCPYGIERTWDKGCEKCECHEDPCVRKTCPVGTSCVAIAQKDRITQEPRFSATCRPVTDPNEVLPDCDRLNAECAKLRCEYGVQRTRTAEGCERCSCVQVEIDCEPLRRECERLKCNYGVEKLYGVDGCERCRCTPHPCVNTECAPGERCVATPYSDPITHETKYNSECRTVNKTGYCPSEPPTADTSCRQGCKDDADCRGVGKCCERGCSRVCAIPTPPTSSPAIIYTTTHSPDLPQAPEANTRETEPEVVAAEGGKVALRCLFHGNPPPKITWRRGEITIEGDVDRYRLLSDGTLEIVSLYRNDSGVYICIGENSLGTARQEIQLQVSDPVETPAGIAGEQNAVLIGELGKRFVIRCLTYGSPPPTVSWHRGLYGAMVPYSSALYEARNNVLLIRTLTYETVGEYACEAYNGVGRPSSWLVVVKAYQIDDTPTDNPYILPRARDENEALLDRVIDATTRINILPVTTTSATPEPDSIDFDKPIFTVPVATRISAPSTSLTAGSELTLTCEVDGYPEPDVYWAKDGKRIIPTDNIKIIGTSLSRLMVSRVTLSDAGNYECHAQNAYSSHYSYVQINIEQLSIPAKCTDNPFFANCHLIVRSKFCQHKYYSKFCCKSCLEAGQLSPQEVEMQADQPLTKRK